MHRQISPVFAVAGIRTDKKMRFVLELFCKRDGGISDVSIWEYYGYSCNFILFALF